MSTDSAWEQWGVRDPYYGVLTNPKFRAAALDHDAKREFFASGGDHVSQVITTCRGRIDPEFAPRRVLDFGCGVGRLVIPFSHVAQEVVGMDVAPSMLAEARRNCDERGIANVSLVTSDDLLSQAEGEFDLVHSSIVLQHIEVARGRGLFEQLVRKIRHGGCGAIHVTFGWDIHAPTFGTPPPPPVPIPPPTDALSVAKATVKRLLEPLGRTPKDEASQPERADQAEPPDPEMQMNYYNLSELMFILHTAGVQRLYTELTDHGGALGAFLFFQKTGVAASCPVVA